MSGADVTGWADDAVQEPVPDPTVEPAEQIAHLIPALWRTLKRASGGSGQNLPATEAQVTILRLVTLRDGLTPAQLADELHVARSTVSNLLKGLIRDRLVERRTDPHDARVVTIGATAKGRDILQTFRQDRTDALRTALGGFPEHAHQIDGGDLAATLRRLLGRLEAVAAQRESADNEKRP
ncbi:MAG: MarR family winged helix-turn-helix transcriptional regulator [Propionibacteriaceae bacterium]|jgi:DNA-binding MarR family transcriptional regulator|nr:MarR family winged helix-turn-helix transcriptional regulator [Propionibacteriaceae bacterium]